MYVFGRNVLKEILESDYKVSQVYFTNSQKSDKELKKLINVVNSKGISSSFVPVEVLGNMVQNSKHQGVVIDIGKEFKYADLDIIKKYEKPFVVMLDQVKDPHNFGAIIRSAVAAGANAIIIPEKDAVHVTSTVIKVSAGQVFKVPIIIETNLKNTLNYLKENNIWIYSAAMGNKAYYEVDMKDGVCIIVGNEGNGVRNKIVQMSDEVISIPMANNVESLNVSVAAGIILFEAKKQRDML